MSRRRNPKGGDVDPGRATERDTDAQAKTYRVTNPTHEVHGHTLGETFTALITEGQEACLLEGGHIEIVEAKPSDPNPQQEG